MSATSRKDDDVYIDHEAGTHKLDSQQSKSDTVGTDIRTCTAHATKPAQASFRADRKSDKQYVITRRNPAGAKRDRDGIKLIGEGGSNEPS